MNKTALALLALLLPGAAIAQVPQTLPPNTVVGRTGITAGPPQAIPFNVLSTQLSLACALFGAGTAGCVPASGGGTTNFLRADGTWAAPPGGGGGGTPAGANTQVQFNSGGLSFGASPNFTWANPVLTLGLAGSTTGQLGMAGGTSGTTLLQANATASGTLTLPAATDTLSGKATTDVFTNKTLDTAGSGNVFKINGTTITSISGNTAKVVTTTGALVNAHCAQWDASFNLVDSGAGCGGGGGTPGNPANSVQFNSAGAFGGSANFLWDGTGVTLGVSGVLGYAKFGNATSGTVTLQPVTGALGAVTVSLPAATDTLVGKATTDALTNKTYNGLTVSTTTGTLTVTNGKTLSPTSTLTLAGTDGKTLTVSKSLTLDGTDGTVMTFPSVSATITRTVASGAKALATGAITSATCTAAQTDTATGTLTTDAVIVSFNGDPTAVTGYIPATTGMLTIIPYPTADTVNFKVCNNTTASITPGAVTINWRVVR